MEHDKHEKQDERLERIRPGRTPQPGGRSSRGPAVHLGGEEEFGGLVPPYEGRKTQADSTDAPRPPEAGDENLGGATGIKQWDGRLAAPSVESLPNRGTAAPAQSEEQPASDYADQDSDYEGVGPAHMKGTHTGEGRARKQEKKKSEEEREEARKFPGVKPSPPTEPQMPSMHSGDQGG